MDIPHLRLCVEAGDSKGDATWPGGENPHISRGVQPGARSAVLRSVLWMAHRRRHQRTPHTHPLYCPEPGMSKILVVEDDPDIANLIRLYLEKAGHIVHRLASGGGVLARLRSDPPELIILDLMLPEIDGLTLCQAIRRDSATAAIPVIMLTARGDEADRVAGLELGADD